MNNEQFRRLVSANLGVSQNEAPRSTKPNSAPRMLLGARPKSSVRTGRSYGAELFKKTSGEKELNKTKSSIPKGTKLAAGYVDRTQQRRENEEEDETAQKLKALEERMKNGEIDEETFERMRDEITGGDISRTHLVKGLDRKLLERVRRGENVLALQDKNGTSEENHVGDEDAAFEELEKHEVVATVREDRVKQGEKAKIIPASIAGQKRTRDEILADLKAQREAAKAAARPQLGSGFKKIRKSDGPKIEIDEKGREVLITTDEHGNVKRKIKKFKPSPSQETRESPVNKEQPLGADVNIPMFEPKMEEESDEDIFENAGHDFNPLADLNDSDASENEATTTHKNDHQDEASNSGSEAETKGGPHTEHMVSSSTGTKNYFNDDPSSFSVLSTIKNNLSDPSVIAALAKSQRAQNVAAEDSQALTAEDEARRKRREAMLASQDRDMEDMDMGFGGSRFEDAEDMAIDGEKVKFSKWKGLGGEDSDDYEGGRGRGGSKRKRGPKKRKGDKNSMADVMRVMENQRKG
ncbi:uncharacterized protein PV09_05668 [Verruconis gallopava]|uniref:RED-like N-terminal domain-containing protein n=1 Tax=Verruconis gallopava TaxID=253628 RepID=A0A0D2A902_9PEZI|nr:uncharacterized protein PV09_05668 [Verruconis gallopava]KIW03010.1 hypothetical protein PV09_05668 [Verruconis gallopava]